MSELQLLPSIILFLSGAIVGVLTTLGFNKIKTGSASANTLKKEKDQYQADVEAHFEETSKKFKTMASQYQDLYQHLSVGATTLCRPENIAPGLVDKSSELNAESIEAKATEPKPSENQANQSTDMKKGSKQSANDDATKNANKSAVEDVAKSKEAEVKDAVSEKTQDAKPVSVKDEKPVSVKDANQSSKSTSSSKTQPNTQEQPKAKK